MQRYFAIQKKENKFILDEKDIHHILNVMRMKNNEHIEVVYENTLYECYINITEKTEIILDKIIKQETTNQPEIIIIIPVLKEQKMDIILQKSTELGVNKIIPITTERSIVKTEGKEKNKIDRWKRIVKEASEQSKRISVPIIENITKIDKLNFTDGVKLVCSTRENIKNIKNVMQIHKNCDKIYIVAGPEGGLSIKEEKKLNELGFVSISLGKRILRIETVPLFVLSCINYELLE
ncbi:MAG: 16S rRNA (uracil(1498)-N(3))-methyltransferase [Bacilli bacterium]|nr:16S rRNA (uracil(1498)-N(3))-methyltransferase [Bacilli bacterium]